MRGHQRVSINKSARLDVDVRSRERLIWRFLHQSDEAPADPPGKVGCSLIGTTVNPRMTQSHD